MTQRTAQRSKPTQRRRYSLFAAMYRARFPPTEKPGAGDGVLLLVGKTLGPSPKVIAKVENAIRQTADLWFGSLLSTSKSRRSGRQRQRAAGPRASSIPSPRSGGT